MRSEELVVDLSHPLPNSLARDQEQNLHRGHGDINSSSRGGGNDSSSH